MTRLLLLATALAALGFGATPAAVSACVLDGDCPVMECNTATCDAGTCVYTPSDELALCDDGDKCTLGERCLLGVCTPPLDAGKDTDQDGDCDADEAACGCDPNDGQEVCPLPNRLVGRFGSGIGEVLLSWNSPTVRRVDVLTDPSCATAGVCANGRCSVGKVADRCATDAECDQAPNTCRVVVNWAATPDLALELALFAREPVDWFTVKPGCSRKVDVPIIPGRSATLKLKAAGTINGRVWRDRDRIRFR
jgi:hypothetical protein